MAFFHQLRLLIWKNGLGIIRQPGWSLTLVLWPVIIFLILAITRHRFPPVMKDACYTGPKNLPSTGFFPFLQTLMCNTDSSCHNKSRQVTHRGDTSRNTGHSLQGPPMAKIVEGASGFHQAWTQETRWTKRAMLDLWEDIIISVKQPRPPNKALMDAFNNTQASPLAMGAMLESMNTAKRLLCTWGLSAVNTSSPGPLSYGVVTFCQSNDTLLEVSLLTINKMLMGVMLSGPGDALTAAGQVLMTFNQMQNDTSLFDSLFAIPRLLASESLDQALVDTQTLLVNLQSALRMVQKTYPDMAASVSMVHPLLAGGINTIQYMEKWPGRDVYITLGDVVTLQNNSLASDAVQLVLQRVTIPLDKAMGLTLDRPMLRAHICNGSSASSLWLSAACMTGTVDMLLDWISPDKVAEQILLVWSRDVAAHDVTFVKGLLHSLMGMSGTAEGSGGPDPPTRAQRSVDVQPQDIYEELFLTVGHVVLDIAKSVPEVDAVLQSLLTSCFTSLQTAALTVDTVEEMMDDVLTDAGQLQENFLMLMTNQTHSSAWFGHVMDSLIEIIMKGATAQGPVPCESLLAPMEWLLAYQTVDGSFWRALLCQNGSSVEQVLQMGWTPLIQKVQQTYAAIVSQADYNVTLPMILSEWQKLFNGIVQLGRLSGELGEGYWTRWVSWNITYDVPGTLMESAMWAVVRFGESLESSPMWPQVKTYMHMANWIVNYKPNVTTEPANCSLDISTFSVDCDTGLKWPQFVHATSRAMMTLPNKPEILISCLQGTVSLLQHVYGGALKHQAASLFKQEIPGGDALSAYLSDMVSNLDTFFQTMTRLNDSHLSDAEVLLPLVHNLLQSAGLSPLVPLLYADGPVNVSTLLAAAVKLGRQNQYVFAFNETDPTMPDLERMLMRLLSMEGNLTLPLSLSMGHTLLTYSGSLSPEGVARLREALRPFTNQTSTGLAEAILTAVELLKRAVDAPDGDPTHIILGCLRQLQEFLASALRLRRLDQFYLPGGQLSTGQVTDLSLVAMDILKLVTPEGLQNLTVAGPDAAQKVVLGKILALLPPEAQAQAQGFIADLQTVSWIDCNLAITSGRNCAASFSEFITLLQQIVELMVEGKGSVTINLAPANPFLRNQESMQMTVTMFSLLLPPGDVAYVKTFNQTLHFIKLLLAKPNVTVSDVQNALRQSNLTLAELNGIAALAGAANINDLMVNILGIVKARQCFEPQGTTAVTTQCVVGLVNGLTGFLTNVPYLRNQTAILSLIPLIVNKTISEVTYTDFSSDPHMATLQILNSALANIEMNLQLLNLSSPEIANEIRVVEGLLKLAANTGPFNTLNSTLLENSQYAQLVYLEIAQWYLERLQNATSTSSFHSLLGPLYRFTEMQVAVQLAQSNFSLFVSNQVEQLMQDLRYPIDGTGMSEIGQTVIEILQRQMELIKFNLEVQSGYFQGMDEEPVLNTTVLYSVENQITQQLNLIRVWMKHPSVTSVFSSMLLWGSNSTNPPSPGTDIHQLLQTMSLFLSSEQQTYLSLIENATQALNNVVMVAQRPGGLQSAQFSGAIAEVVQIAMHGLTAVTGPLPLSVREAVQSAIQDSLHLVSSGNFRSDPHMATMQVLYGALTNIKTSLQLMNLSSSEIRNEIRMVEGLLNLAANTEPLKALNSTLMENALYAQVVYLEIAQWYLKELENATSTSSLNSFLNLFYRFTEMQLAVQLAQANLTLVVSYKVEHLTKNLRHPIDGTGLSAIGQTVIEILQHQIKFQRLNLESQNDFFEHIDQEPMFNTTALYSVENQITQQLNLIRDWMKHPNVTSVFSSMLQWGSNSTDSSPGTDIHQLLQTMSPFFSSEIVDNVTQALIKALAVAQRPGGLQSAQFSDAVSEAVQIAMHGLTTVTGPLPASVQETILKAVQDSLHLTSYANFSSDPHMATVQLLNSVLANIKMNLQLMNLSSPEIMNEIRMVEGLLKLVANTGPLNALSSSTLLENPEYAQVVYLEIAQWYLKELENATSTSSLNRFLYPFYRFTDMQVAVQILYANFSVFVSDQVQQLTVNLHYPIDGTGMSAIGQTVIEILLQQMELFKFNLEFQNDFYQSLGLGLLVNTTVLYPVENQIMWQLNLIHNWMKHPSVTSVFSSMLQWGSSSSNSSSPGTDIHQLLQTLSPFLSSEQQTYLSLIDNATLALTNVFMVAQRPGGLQSAQFSGAISEVVRTAMHGLTAVTGPLPLSLRETVQGVVQDLFSSISDGDLGALSNITISVHLMNLTTFEIMNEIRVVEALLNLATNTGPLNALNSTLLENPQYAQVVYLEIAQWYLEKVEKVARTSSFSSLLDPLFRFTEMQVALQLAQANFSLFVSNQVEQLMQDLRYPIDGTGMSQIGQTVIEILQRQMELITFNLERQNDYFQGLGQGPLCNSTTLYAVEYEITQQMNLIRVWMKHPNVTSVFSSMLQWGSNSTNPPSPATDIHQLLQTMSPFFSSEQLTFLSLIDNVTQALNAAVMVAQRPGGLQSAQFLEAVQAAMHSLTPLTGSLPASLSENILSVLQGSLHLILNPEMAYASARNISMHLLESAEHLVRLIVPEMLADYLLPGIQIMETYFRTISTSSGPNIMNEIILNEMETIKSVLPSNMTQAYISLIINITQFILEPSQGNMNIWTSFETGNLSVIISQIGELLNTILPFFTGDHGINITIPSLEDFTQLGPVLEQILMEEANQDTWEKLKKMLEAVLSNFKGTELWDDIPPAMSLVEVVLGVEIKQMMAETAFIWSLQGPVLNLMEEAVLSVNTSRSNLSAVIERMEEAISGTMHATQQANGTALLQCSQVLGLWEPVREAAGLSEAFLTAWCNVSLQPVIHAYAHSDAVYNNLHSVTQRPGTTATVPAVAASLVEALRALYLADLKQGLALEGLIMAFCSKLEQLAARPVSAEAEHHWLKQFQEAQLMQSLELTAYLTEEVGRSSPALRVYAEAGNKALTHVLQNVQHAQNASAARDLLLEAGHVLLTSLNISSDAVLPLLWGNASGVDGAALGDLAKQVVALVIRTQAFGDVPMIYQAMEKLVASNGTALAVEQMYEVLAWWSSTQAAGMDFVTQAVSRVFGLLRAFLPVLTDVGTAVGAALDLPADAEMFEALIESVVDTISQMGSTGDLLTAIEQFLEDLEELSQQQQQQQQANSHAGSRRRRREAPVQPAREPMDDFIDLFFVDYRGLFEAISVPPTVPEMVETAHVFFSNADLGVVMKGATKDLPWALNSSKEDTIDAALGMLSYLTLPHDVQTLSMDLLMEAVNVIPDGLPLAGLIKNVAGGFASESQENLMFMQQTLLTAWDLLGVSPMDQRFTEILGRLTSQVCAVEQMSSVQGLWQAVSMEAGLMCKTLLPSLQLLAQGLQMNASELSESLFQVFIGNPSDYDVHSDWATVFSESFGLNASSLQALNINVTSQGVVTVGEVLRNKSAFMLDVQQNMEFDPRALSALMETPLPNSNLAILSWLVNLRLCSDDSSSLNLSQAEQMVFQGFCSLSVHQWYTFSLLLARHINTEKLIYRLVLSQDMQNLVGVVLQMASFLTDLLSKLEPAIGRLDGYIRSLGDLNVMAGHDFKRVERSADPSKPASRTATFTTLSRALCSKGILAVFGISKLTIMSETDSSLPQSQAREELIKQFKIPRDASPFCMSLYLDMVNTTGGAIAWAFLKPMLMGHILYTPDTPLTRAIMEKSNNTLQEFANLRSYSEDWIESSGYISKSARLLTDTLPMLQNSLGNSFVENFIQMQTNINVGSMKDTLSNFSNMTLMLEKNQEILKQITTLSNLMVNISSCIKFDRYRGFDSAEELNAVAQDLAKDRNLYGSVIFKLPKDEEGSPKNDARSSSSSASSTSSTLPPRVRYTIRMHMDNLMRTDRVRNPYFVRDHHISAAMTLRYNRGFVYLQESIDRAIIETQAGRRVTEPAVQLQPFPYPCFIRDEYLEAISFVFPLMLMIAWVLFVADFVKKLVHEREMRLHEYMKMMGVNPLSHFFAWFLECAAYLVFTIFILTLVLKYGRILPQSDGFLLFLYFCDYGLSIVAISYLVSAFFDKTYIAGLSGSLVYVLCFFPFIVMMALESKLSFSGKSALGLFAPTCFSYASQYVSRYESQGEGIQWSNSYVSPMAGDTASFGWLCWLMLIDSLLYFIMGGYIRMVFPGKYGIPAPWYFPFKPSFWSELCSSRGPVPLAKGMLFTNIMQKKDLPVFHHGDKGKGEKTFSPQEDEETSGLPVGVALHGLTKMYGERPAIQNLNLSFYEGQVTSLLGHNGAGKTTTMSLLTGLFAPSSGTIEVYGRDMQANIEDVRKELGVCMQYDVHFDHMTAKEHLMLYGQIKAPYWSRRELDEQVCKILQETGMYAHRHKRVGTLSGGMKRKLSISIAFIGGSRLVVLDEPTTGVDPCSRRSIWDIVIQHKKERTIIMSTHHLDEAEVLSDRIAFLERGGLKVCGTPLHLKDKLGQGYNLTVTKKVQSADSSEARFDSSELKEFIQAHVPEARLKEAHGGDLVYSLPPFTSSNASAYRSLLTALDANLDALQLGCYGISDTTLEEVFLQLTQDNPQTEDEDRPPLSVSESISDFGSTETLPEDLVGSGDYFNDKTSLTGSSTVKGLALTWQQVSAMLVKRFHHSRRDWKGLISQIVLPVLFVLFAMGLGSIRNDLQHYPELELSPALYNLGPSYSFFSNQNPSSSGLVDSMMSFPGIDNACLDEPESKLCSATRNTHAWKASGNSSQPFSICKCTQQEQVCNTNNYQPPSKKIASSQSVYNLTSYDVENYLVSTANDFIRNRYGGFAFGKPLPPGLQMDLMEVPRNRTVSKVWYNPEGHHTMPAYLNSLNNFILRSNLPADKDPRKYAISVSSHPYYGRADDEDAVVQGMIQILVALCVLTGYSIMTASFAIYEVHEHHSGSKRLQHISGISEPLYWAVNFFYDMVLYMVPVALTVAVVAIFQVPAFTEKHNLGAVTLLLVLFGFATFPWMYLLSGIFKDAEMAFITYVCINLFISVNTIMTTSILFFMGQLTYHNEAIQKIFTTLSNAFLIFPQFSFGNGLMEMARTNMEVQLLSGYGIDAYKDPFSTDTLGWMFISSIIQGLVFFTLRLLINKGLIRTVRHLVLGRKVVPQANDADDDEDVVAERERMASGAAHTDLLQVNQLTKIYQHLSRKVHAVKRLSVGIPAGECFGLLGVNGAGKTTTFKMLTGDVSPTDGTAQIKDWDGRMVDIMECRNQGINIGYCPQVDALDDLLTGEEHLYFYARVRGIATGEIHSVVNYLLKKLELDYHRNTITDGYSCGTRRKLSTALALIGHPQILLLDEPSSGMDPRTKRHLWKIISEEVKGKCAVVLTSHSMEECEALCSRLAIMVKGQFRCLGSLQHIKNRFGSGFTVKMYLARASCDVEAITSFMRQRFPSTYLKDQHSAMVEYHVPVAPGGVAHIFDQLESSKTTLQIKHFSISQTTLDEVFINFAMGKVGMETIPLNSSEDSDSLFSIESIDT